jgi:cytochrome b
LRRQEPRANVVQMALQGSLLLQVNAGPLAICQAFLAPDAAAAHSPADRAALLASVHKFVRALEVILLFFGIVLLLCLIHFYCYFYRVVLM